MSSLEQIFLDMDGVLTDIAGAILSLHGQSRLRENCPEGERETYAVPGISESEFWQIVNRQGVEFWAGLPALDWSRGLVDLTRQFGPITVLASPGPSPSCFAGTVRWLHDNFSQVDDQPFSDFLIGRPVMLLAGPRRVLIDDSESNVGAFRMAGGEAILLPQPWNANHAIDDRLGYVKAQLGLLEKAISLDDDEQPGWSRLSLSRISRAMVGEPFRLSELLNVGAESVALRLVDGNVVKIATNLTLPDPNPFSLSVVDWGYLSTEGIEALWYIQPFATTPIEERDFQPFLAALRGASLRMTDPSIHNLGYYEGEIKILDPWSVIPLSGETT